MKQCRYLGVLTGKEFETHYNKMIADGEDIKASTLIPIIADGEETHSIFHCWVYYDTAGKAVEEPKKKLTFE